MKRYGIFAALGILALILLTALLTGHEEKPTVEEANKQTLSPTARLAPITPTPAATPTPEPLIELTQPQILVFVRRTLHESNVSAFTRTQLSLISYVELEGAALNDLSELALLPNLEALILRETSATDLSPLAELPTLYSLTLINNPLPDAAALCKLERLTKLVLDNSPVGNCRALAGMPSLRRLTMVNSGSAADVAYLKKQLAEATVLETVSDAAAN